MSRPTPLRQSTAAMHAPGGVMPSVVSLALQPRLRRAALLPPPPTRALQALRAAVGRGCWAASLGAMRAAQAEGTAHNCPVLTDALVAPALALAVEHGRWSEAVRTFEAVMAAGVDPGPASELHAAAALSVGRRRLRCQGLHRLLRCTRGDAAPALTIDAPGSPEEIFADRADATGTAPPPQWSGSQGSSRPGVEPETLLAEVSRDPRLAATVPIALLRTLLDQALPPDAVYAPAPSDPSLSAFGALFAERVAAECAAAMDTPGAAPPVVWRAAQHCYTSDMAGLKAELSGAAWLMPDRASLVVAFPSLAEAARHRRVLLTHGTLCDMWDAAAAPGPARMAVVRSLSLLLSREANARVLSPLETALALGAAAAEYGVESDDPDELLAATARLVADASDSVAVHAKGLGLRRACHAFGVSVV